MNVCIFNGYFYIDDLKRSHIVWNFNNPNNPWKKGYVIHHKDSNKLNDSLENLQLILKADHVKLHHTNKFIGKETREKLSKINIGRIVSEETKRNLSKSLKGRSVWNKGKQFSEESKKKMSIAQTGKKLSEETKNKIAEAARNQVWTEERKHNISMAKKGKSYNRPNYKHSEETRKKISESNKRKHL